MTADLSAATRIGLCRDSLTGLSVGDALGAMFFMPGHSRAALAAGRPPAGPWQWTDDTEMACSIAAHLGDLGGIDQDALAEAFARRCEPHRGYGPGAVVLLHRIREGAPWRTAAGELFNGEGSCGNGAAMRVAPLGAYFAGDVLLAASEAARSAEVTHAHPEGVAGAVGVAAAAAIAAAARIAGERPAPEHFLTAVLGALDAGSEVAQGVRDALALVGGSAIEAAYELGNGSQAIAQDTVPFTLWVAATHLDAYPIAITTCIDAGGDIDTTAAIAGGIIAAYTGVGDRPGVRGVPATWLAAREALPGWVDLTR
jgi:ADP-ribosylglycohydrolase